LYSSIHPDVHLIHTISVFLSPSSGKLLHRVKRRACEPSRHVFFLNGSRICLFKVAHWENTFRMERMESMEPISACYTTAYPEIHPDSGYGSGENTENQAKTPPAPTYDEDLVHKFFSSFFRGQFC
ncbi:hypothetical protein AMECASPLE_026725, partial [Ameca splendens]